MSTITKETTESVQVTAAEYVHSVYESVVARNPHEDEFHQAVKEILDSLIPVIEAHLSIRTIVCWNSLLNLNV